MKYILLSLLFAGAVHADAKSCRALAMSGGGSKGSYEAGVLYGLINNDETSNFEWDVVTGVSAGSLNTAVVTGFEKGDEKNMVQYLSDLFSNVNTEDAYVGWKLGGMVRGLTDKQGVFNIDPARELMHKVTTELGTCKRKFGVSSVDVKSGSYNVWNETLPREEHERAFISSALIPGVFEPDHWKDKVLMDGGTVYNVNLASAVQRCREQVDDDSEITLDIVVCGYPDIDQEWQFKDHAINNFLRYRDISSFYKSAADVYNFRMAFPKVNFRYFVAPSESLPGNGLGMLDFTNATSTWPMQMIGRKDGENAAKSGTGYMFEKMTEWGQSEELQKEYPKIGDYLFKVNKEEAHKWKQERRHREAEEMPPILDFVQK